MSTVSKMAPLDSKQYDLFSAVPVQDARRSSASDLGRRFITGNAHEIILGTTRLEEWLKQAGQNAPLVTRLLEQQDRQAFEKRHAGPILHGASRAYINRAKGFIGTPMGDFVRPVQVRINFMRSTSRPASALQPLPSHSGHLMMRCTTASFGRSSPGHGFQMRCSQH